MEPIQDRYLWTEKYRPSKIKDCILPENLKNTFQEFVNVGDFPNLILSGGPGMGKTTVGKALCNELGYEAYFINASLDADKDMLKNQINNFVSSISLSGNKKCVILDEADHLSSTHVQPGLRTFMEQHSDNARFILTCNYKNKIIPALHSRCAVIEFKVSNADNAKMMAGFFNRCLEILKTENVTYDQAVVAEIIKKHYPDCRRILNELQRAAKNGKIDTSALIAIGNLDVSVLMKALKEKDFKSTRKWVVDNSNNDYTMLFRKMYDGMYDFLKEDSIPQMVVLLGEYSYKIGFAADPEITIMAFMVEVMANIEFK